MLKGRGAHIISGWLLLTVLFLAAGMDSARGQRVYASGDTPFSGQSGTKGTSNFTNPTGGPATMSIVSNSGLAPVTQVGWITFKFSSAVPSSKIVFVKIDAINSNVITQAYNGTTLVATSQTTTFTSSSGDIYYAVSAGSTFDRIRITATAPANILGSSTNATVYYPFYESGACSAIFSSSLGGGLLGGTVSSPLLAFDGNSATSSVLTPAALLSSIEQSVHFDSKSLATDQIKITLSAPANPLLTLALLNNISINGYNGNTSAWNIGVGSVLDLSLLGLLKTGAPVTLTITPPSTFDRIGINFGSVANLFTTLNIHEIQRVPTTPTLVVSTATICIGNSATLSATNPGTGYEIRWYDQISGGTLLNTGLIYSPSPTSTKTYYVASARTGCTEESERVPATVTVTPQPTTAAAGPAQNLCSVTSTTLAGNTPTIGTGAWSQVSGPNTASISTPSAGNSGVTGMVAGTYVFRWTISNSPCTASTSDVTVVIGTTPTITLGTAPSACQQITTAPLIYTAVTGSPTTYSIVWGSAALTAGFNNVSDASLPASPINLVVPATAPMAAYSATITVKNAGGCLSTAVPFTFTVHPKPAAPSFSVTTSN